MHFGFVNYVCVCACVYVKRWDAFIHPKWPMRFSFVIEYTAGDLMYAFCVFV